MIVKKSLSFIAFSIILAACPETELGITPTAIETEGPICELPCTEEVKLTASGEVR